MRSGFLALAGAVILLIGALSAPAQAASYPVTGTSRLVWIVHTESGTGQTVQIRDIFITESILTIVTPDGSITLSPTYTLFDVTGFRDETGKATLTGLAYPMVGAWENFQLAGYSTQVSIQRSLESYDAVHHIGAWQTQTHYVLRQPTGETLQIHETGLMRGTVGSLGDYAYVGEITGRLIVPGGNLS